MQLRLIRFDLLILLLVSLIHVEALEKLSRVAAMTLSPTAMPFQRLSSSSWASDADIFESSEIYGFVTQEDPKSRGTQRRRDTRNKTGGKTVSKWTTFRPSHSTTLLAEKLAEDALRSKEMQDTIKELTSLNGDHKKHHEMSTETDLVSQSTATSHSAGHAAKTIVKSDVHGRHKGQGKRKHDRHRKQGRKHRHPKRRLKRHHPKKESSKTAHERKSRKSISRGRRRGLKGKYSSEKSVTCRRKRSDRIAKTRKQINQTSGENLGAFINRDENFIEELPSLESTHRQYVRNPISRKGEKKGDTVNRKRSHMIAQLMITTTRDPTKKKPGDQGVEYSEYYSDNDNVLSPDIRAQSKLDEVAKTLLGGQIRSAREAADKNLFDQHYYDSSNEQLLEEDGERSKRNDEKFVRVMEEPSNSMEYVDNTYGPAPANGVVDNEQIPQYLNNYNYISDQDAQRQGDTLSNPSAELIGLRQPIPNQFSPDVLRILNQNPSLVETLPNKAPLNMIPSMAIKLNVNPRINNGVLGNDGLSLLPHTQPRRAEGNLPYLSVSEIPLQHSTSSLNSLFQARPMPTSPGRIVQGVNDIRVIVPESKKLSKLYATTSVTTSLSGLNPTPSYDDFKKNSRIFGSETLGKATSLAPASPKASLASLRMKSSPIDISLVTLDSPELFSRLRDIRPEPGAQKVKYVNENNGVENNWGPDQIEPIASRGTVMEGTAVKNGKRKGSHLTKTDVEPLTTVSEMNDVKNYGASSASKGIDCNLLPTTTSQAPVSLGSSVPEPVNTTLVTNETKAVASEILNEIIDELEELKLENPKNEEKEGLPCRLTGSWVTARAGVRVDMKVTNHSVRVSLDYLTPPITTEGLLNVTWNVTGFAPFKRGGPFTLLATNNHTKTLAVFVGACKVCQGIDTIEGSWTVSREPRDCRDFQMSTNIFNEIFRRTRLYSAIKDKQLKHETQTSTTMVTTSGNSSTLESTVHDVLDHLEKFHNKSSEFNGTE